MEEIINEYGDSIIAFISAGLVVGLFMALIHAIFVPGIIMMIDIVL